MVFKPPTARFIDSFGSAPDISYINEGVSIFDVGCFDIKVPSASGLTQNEIVKSGPKVNWGLEAPVKGESFIFEPAEALK